MHLNIVLIEPQIPNNTGNIGRLCVATQCHLHLVKPMGFEITDSRVKRAGLDYWPDLELTMYDSFEEWYSQVTNPNRVFFFSARATTSLYSLEFQEGDWLVFGKEADGLGPELLSRFEDQCLTIPFPGKVRSFNLANSVAMVLGETMRQSQI
ncbi:MAG: tRNA (cytidine(34)-2'-O)-methyltransferase [Flavobacteriales bacterium]|nr:tRNA (cytidine(34)-2'-O)-methyltransferase [Flavobacteriales bacterium]